MGDVAGPRSHDPLRLFWASEPAMSNGRRRRSAVDDELSALRV